MNLQRNDSIAMFSFIVAFVVVVIAAFISYGGIPYTSQETCTLENVGRPPAFWCWIYGWQTLIAGLIAFAGAAFTVRQMRRELRQKELLRIWNVVGHCQATRADLLFIKSNFKQLIEEAKRNRPNPIPRTRLTIFDWEGTNIPPDVDPILNSLISKLWQAKSKQIQLIEHPGAPKILERSDFISFLGYIDQVDQIIATVDQAMEPIVSDLQAAGMDIWRDQKGFYRRDNTKKFRL